MPTYSSFNALGSSIEAGEIGTGAVTADKIAADAVTEAKINSAAVGSSVFIHLIQPDTVHQGTFSFNVENNSGYNGQIVNSSGNNGDSCSWDFWLEKGTYKILILYKKGDKGIGDVYFNDSEEASIDFYNAAAQYNLIEEITGLSVTTAGLQNLKFIVDGKNASATNYTLALNSIFIIKTA